MPKIFIAVAVVAATILFGYLGAALIEAGAVYLLLAALAVGVALKAAPDALQLLAHKWSRLG